MKILFTCLGNICRSPLAEAILREKATSANLDWLVSSNGTNRFHKGDAADPRTIKVGLKYGVDIRKHIARRFTFSDFQKYDLIICMAADVFDEMKEFVTDEKQLQNVIISHFDDPWYGDETDFERCFKSIESYCDNLILEIKTKETVKIKK